MAGKYTKRALVVLPILGGCVYGIRKLSEDRPGTVRAAGAGAATPGLGPAKQEQVPAADARKWKKISTLPRHLDCDRSKESATSDEQALKLVNVQIFVRHGARTPLYHLPGVDEVFYDKRFIIGVVPYAVVPSLIVRDLLTGGPRPESAMDKRYQSRVFQGGVTSGLLTKLGKDQAYVLGKKLRKHYQEEMQFIGNSYTAKDVYARSTAIQRCIDSLECVLAGLYDPKDLQQAEPVVVEVMPTQEEYLFPNIRHCQTLGALERLTPHYLNQNPDFLEVLGKIESHIEGVTDKRKTDMMNWRDHIVCRKAHGLPVPRWLEDLQEEISKMAVLTSHTFMCGSGQKDSLVLKLSAGPMYHLVQETMLNAINNKPRAKMHLYCCHDSTLMPLLEVLQCKTDMWPPYVADLRFELYEDSKKQNWVRISYCDEILTPPGCTQPLMTLTQFQKVVQPFTVGPADYEHMCVDFKAARKQATLLDTTTAPSEEEVYAPPNI